MKIALIFAMPVERDAYLALAQNASASTHQISTHLCGIGKVNASLNTQKIITQEAPELVINVGVAGGINAAQQFDVYIGQQLNYADVDLQVFGYALGQMAGMPATYACKTVALPQIASRRVAYGRIVTQDTFALGAQEAFFKQHFADYQIVDMESTAIAQTCFVNQVDFLSVRAISDCIFQPNQHLEYEKAANLAASLAAEATQQILAQL
jgi:adenosylhomocysteine nucleosidase